MAAADLLQADLDRLLVKPRLFAHALAQGNGLEAAAVLQTQLTQPRTEA